jgi:hypothetical protein
MKAWGERLTTTRHRSGSAAAILFHRNPSYTMIDWCYFKKRGLEIRVDFSRPDTDVEYSFETNDNEWTKWRSAPFKSRQFNGYCEKEPSAWQAVNDWLEGRYLGK